MIATLNDPKLKSGKILNACVQALVIEMVWIILGPEFRKDARETAVFGRALYGLKFWSHIFRCMESLGYESCKVNSDLLL